MSSLDEFTAHPCVHLHSSRDLCDFARKARHIKSGAQQQTGRYEETKCVGWTAHQPSQWKTIRNMRTFWTMKTTNNSMWCDRRTYQQLLPGLTDVTTSVSPTRIRWLWCSWSAYVNAVAMPTIISGMPHDKRLYIDSEYVKIKLN